MLSLKKITIYCSLLIVLWPIFSNAEEPTILINEIAWMGTETSGTDEWIELYNSTGSEIDLAGWKLEAADGSPKINLEGTIAAGAYFLLERTNDDSVANITADQIYTGSLSNSGESINLYDSENNLVDEIISTDGWNGGDNSTKQTLERSSLNNWQTSAEPGGTPKTKNSTVTQDETPPDEQPTAEEPDTEPSPAQTPEPVLKVNKGDVIITEIFPNPAGIDTKLEFIEIKNVSKVAADLTNFKITNLAKQSFVIPSLKMMPESIVVFYRTQTNLALNNNKEKITLYNTSGRIINRVEYKSPAPEDESYQLNSDKWHWDKISPGENIIIEEEILPIAVIEGPKKAKVGEIITFNASDSFDPENRELNFSWDFGDGRKATGIIARQIYLQPDNYEIKLNVAVNNHASTTEILKIKITTEIKTEIKQEIQALATTTTNAEPIITLEEIPFIFISEFLPNPEGPDTENEFIEIFNFYDKPVNLAGWQLDDAEGGSKPYIIPPGNIIKPGQYLAFFRSITKLALNNSDENVRLFTPNGELVDQTEYKKSKEGVSFVLDENFSWQQSQTPTPGEINILDETPAESKKEEKKTESKILGVEAEVIENNQPKNKNKYIISGISALLILGTGTALKFKKKQNVDEFQK